MKKATQSRLKFNKSQALELIVARVAVGVSDSLAVIEAGAKSRAPVSQDREGPEVGSRMRGERIRPRKEADFRLTRGPGVSTEQWEASLEDASRQSTLIELKPRARVQRFMKLREKNPAIGQVWARRFEFVAGPHKGESPAKIKVARGTLVGIPSSGGTLRKSIHRTELVVGRNFVRGSVRAEAKYAAAQEYGFKHTSHGKATGVQVGAQPFMRPAVHEDFKPRWRELFNPKG